MVADVERGGFRHYARRADEDDVEIGRPFEMEFVTPDASLEHGGNCANGRPEMKFDRGLAEDGKVNVSLYPIGMVTVTWHWCPTKRLVGSMIEIIIGPFSQLH